MTTGIRPLGSHPVGLEMYWQGAGAAAANVYAVIYPDGAAQPTAGQIIAGYAGTAVWAGNVEAPTATAAPFDWPVLATGLTPGQPYRIAFCWTNGADNRLSGDGPFNTLSIAAVAASRIESTANVRAPVVVRVAVAAVAAARIQSTANVRNPVVVADGVRNVAAARIASTAVVRAPQVARLAVVNTTPGRIASTAVVRTPQVARLAVVSTTPGRIESTATVGVPTVAAISSVRQIIVGRIDSTAVVRPPLVQAYSAEPSTEALDTAFYRRAARNVLAGRVPHADGNDVMLRVGARKRARGKY